MSCVLACSSYSDRIALSESATPMDANILADISDLVTQAGACGWTEGGV